MQEDKYGEYRSKYVEGSLSEDDYKHINSIAKHDAYERYKLYQSHVDENGKPSIPKRIYDEPWLLVNEGEKPRAKCVDMYKKFDRSAQLMNEKLVFIHKLIWKDGDFDQLKKNLMEWITDRGELTDAGKEAQEKYDRRKVECKGTHPSVLMSERIWEFFPVQRLSLRMIFNGDFFDLDKFNWRGAFLEQFMRTGKLLVELIVALMPPEERISDASKYPIQPMYYIRSASGELTPVFDSRFIFMSHVVNPILMECSNFFMWKTKTFEEMKEVTDVTKIRHELKDNLLFNILGPETMRTLLPESLGGGTVIATLVDAVYYTNGSFDITKFHTSGGRICSMQILHGRVYRSTNK